MRVLIVKTSSMGDVLHTLPALTDAQQAIPGIQFDWVVKKDSRRSLPGMQPLTGSSQWRFAAGVKPGFQRRLKPSVKRFAMRYVCSSMTR